MRRLLVIVPERVSAWIAKGEVIDRYYNPGERFDEVHLLLLNDDRPDPAALARLGGQAPVIVHNLPVPKHVFLRTLAWRPRLLRRWAEGAVRIADEVRPALVRCHGAHLNAFAALVIRERLGVPYVVSVHTNPDEDYRGRARGIRQRLVSRASVALEREALRSADLVLPVYEPVVPYLRRLGVTRYRVAYNMLNGRSLRRKTEYALGQPPRVICVGRQFAAKDPSELIRAVSRIPEVELTLVGDGELHADLRALATATGCADRCHFHPSVENDELCRLLNEHDVFATHSEFWELSKAVLEALLTGLPVVTNRRTGPPIPELSSDLCVLVPNSADGYEKALRTLLTDHVSRTALGRRAAELAWAKWSPSVAEATFADVYDDILKSATA